MPRPRASRPGGAAAGARDAPHRFAVHRRRARQQLSLRSRAAREREEHDRCAGDLRFAGERQTRRRYQHQSQSESTTCCTRSRRAWPRRGGRFAACYKHSNANAGSEYRFTARSAVHRVARGERQLRLRRLSARRRHRLALRARRARGQVRLPLHRRSRPGLARRRAGDVALRASNVVLAGRSVATGTGQPRHDTAAPSATRCCSTCSATRRPSSRIAASSWTFRIACSPRSARSYRTPCTRDVCDADATTREHRVTTPARRGRRTLRSRHRARRQRLELASRRPMRSSPDRACSAGVHGSQSDGSGA